MDKIKQEIVKLCLNLFGETKAAVKKNNKSAERLIQIFNEIKTQEEYAQQLYAGLLDYNDDRVRFEAATCCFKLGKNIKLAKKTLKRISDQIQIPQ